MKHFFCFLWVFLFAVNLVAQDKNAEGNVGPVKFSGLVFADLFYNADAINPADKDINGFNFKRIYITTDYTIDDKFSTRFRIESALSNGSNIGVFIKDAWLKWRNIFEGSDFIVGMSPTPAYEVSEGAWGYRSLEKTIMDYFGIVSSKDIGLDLKGKLVESGIARYWLKIGNGSGNKPETDKYNRYYAQLQFTPGDFLITLYGDYNSLPQKLDPADSIKKNNSAFVAAGFISYKYEKTFTLGVEGFIKSQQNNFSVTPNNLRETQSGFGVSFWAKAMLSETVGIVGRYDMFDPNTNSSAKNDMQSLIIGAVDFKVAKNVSIMPGVEVRTLEGTDNNDLTPKVTFFWQF